MKKKIFGLVLIAGMIHIIGMAQPTIKKQGTLGGSGDDFLWTICPTKDGGFVAGGKSYSGKSGEKRQDSRGLGDYWIIKIDKQQKIQWQRTIGGNGEDNLKSVIQTSDGGYAVIGESSSTISGEKTQNSRGGTDYWLVKLDSLGRIKWDRTYGGSGTEYIDNVVQTADGGYILAGSSDSYLSGDKSEISRGFFDYWVVRLNKHGEKLWDKTIGGYDYEFCSPIEPTTDGGVMIGGFSQSNISGEKTEDSRGGYDYWVVKLNRFGQIEWDKTLGGNDGDYGRGLQQTDDGGYLMTGSSLSNQSGDKTENSRGGFDFWVVKFDGKGTVQWDKTIGGNADDDGVWNLEKTSDGGYIFGGFSRSSISGEKTEDSRGDADFWIVKLDQSGNIQWDKTIGGDAFDDMISIKEISPNNYLAGGYTYSGISGDKTQESRGGADYWIVNLDYNIPFAKANSQQNESSIIKPGSNNKQLLNVYPNPVRDVLHLQVNGKALVSLTDQAGKIIFTRFVENNASINVANLHAGIYYLKNNTTGAMQTIIVAK